MKVSALLWPLLLGAALTAQATDFKLTPVKLPGGVTVFGTVSTDGSIGPLTAAQLTGWNITVRTTTTHRYNPNQAGGAQVDATVSANGQRMTVKSSPDGVNDGGIVAFGSFGGVEYGVQVANFTGYWGSNGGVAFYLDGPAFDWEWFNAPNGSTRLVARAAPGSPVFTIVPVNFASGAVISGTITTDGSTGRIGPAQIVDWSITARTVSDTVYYRNAKGQNSTLLPASQSFSTDGLQLFVARPDGYLGFGTPAAPPRRGAGAVLADFSATAPSGGQAGYYDAFGLQFRGLKFHGAAYPVGTAIP